MRAAVLFFDVFKKAYLPVVEGVVHAGLLPIMNATPLAETARAAGLPVASWESSIPAELGSRVRSEVDRVTREVSEALADPATHDAFASPYGSFLPHNGGGFFGQIFQMVASQIAALEIFEALIGHYDLRALVLGCDNSHVQRVLIEHARGRGIPSMQLAHGIYAPVEPRVAGEMSTVYADRVAGFGARSRDVLARLGNDPERIALTGAPLWDELYVAAARVSRDAACRELGLDPEQPTVLFCGSYADGSSAFLPDLTRCVTDTYRSLIDGARGGAYQLIVRPHPQELDRAGLAPDARERLIEAHRGLVTGPAGAGVRLITDRKIESIAAADVVVAMGCSTIIPEAMILRRPVVMVPFLQQAPPVYTSADGICVADDADMLWRALGTLLGDPARRRAMVATQLRALPSLNHENDGCATARVAQAIVDVAGGVVSQPRAGGPLLPRGRALDVLLAAHDFLPNRAGTELYTHDLARALERRGHRVRVLCPRYLVHGGPCTVQEGVYQGLPLVAVLMGGDAVRLLRNDAIKPVLREYLTRHRPDVVHVQHLMGLSVTFLELLRELDIPVVLTANDFWFLCEQGHLVHSTGARCDGPETVDDCVRCLRERVGQIPDRELPNVFHHLADRSYQHREAIRIPDLVICPSRFLLDTFRRYGFEARRMVHLPQGAALFAPGTAHRESDGPLVIGYLGTIGHRKGLDLLVDAFNGVDSRHTELHVHGKIIEESYFTETMRSIGPGKMVKYHGAFSPTDLPGILADIDVAVVPSRGENFPFVIREILHAGVPVIAPRVGGIPEIITDGVNGLLFDANDASDLARALEAVIGAPDYVATLRSGIQGVKSIDEEAGEIERHYGEVLAQRPSAEAAGFQVSVVVVVADSLSATERCLTGLAEATDGVDYEVIVVDDAASVETGEWLATLAGDVRVVRNDRRRGMLGARNQGAARATGRYLAFLDPTMVPRRGWLSALLAAAEAHPDLAVVGSKLLDTDGTILHAGIAFSREEGLPYRLYPGCPADLPVVNHGRDLQAVSGTCMLLGRQVFEAAGGFDEEFGTVLGDVDLCLRIHGAGWRIAFEPASVLDRCAGGAEDGDSLAERADTERLRARWSGWELADEDILLVGDGCARRERCENGHVVSVIEPIADSTERSRWEHVAAVQGMVRRGDLQAAVPLLANVDRWPADVSALRWAATLCDRAGVPAHAAALRGRARALDITVPHASCQS
jgi:glycosyltransferase involved in cell wall biosynthesis/GT2 family glycosyltransferase